MSIAPPLQNEDLLYASGIGETAAMYRLKPQRTAGVQLGQVSEINLVATAYPPPPDSFTGAYQRVLVRFALDLSRLRAGDVPVEPDPELGLAAGFLYQLHGRLPDEADARSPPRGRHGSRAGTPLRLVAEAGLGAGDLAMA